MGAHTSCISEHMHTYVQCDNSIIDLRGKLTICLNTISPLEPRSRTFKENMWPGRRFCGSSDFTMV